MRPTRERLAAAGTVVLLALTGCGGGGDADAVPRTATGSLEHLAGVVDCRPDIQTDADELRQAICRNGDGRFVLATFATDRGQREWLNQAKDYGGSYLVGRKWVVVGEPKVVTALRDRLGGTVETGASHHWESGNGGGDGEGGHFGEVRCQASGPGGTCETRPRGARPPQSRSRGRISGSGGPC